jgi:hypothetical protein
MASLQELQAPVEKALIEAVLEEIPLSWRSFCLEISGERLRNPGELSFSLTNLDGLPPVGIDVESPVFVYAAELDALLNSRGGVISKLVYSAREAEDGWRWKCKYEYFSA